MNASDKNIDETLKKQVIELYSRHAPWDQNH